MVIRRFCWSTCTEWQTAEILSFDENGVHPCDYEDADSYQITRVFINHRESLLRHLLGNET